MRYAESVLFCLQLFVCPEQHNGQSIGILVKVLAHWSKYCHTGQNIGTLVKAMASLPYWSNTSVTKHTYIHIYMYNRFVQDFCTSIVRHLLRLMVCLPTGIYVYVFDVCVCMYLCIYIYIYIYRERERERESLLLTYTFINVQRYASIY